MLEMKVTIKTKIDHLSMYDFVMFFVMMVILIEGMNEPNEKNFISLCMTLRKQLSFI